MKEWGKTAGRELLRKAKAPVISRGLIDTERRLRNTYRIALATAKSSKISFVE
jgi:hypothetical protein